MRKPTLDTLKDCVFSITGTFSVSQVDLKKKIKSLGGQVSLNCCSSDVTHILATEENFNDLTKPVKHAIRFNLPIVKEEFLNECVSQSKKVDVDQYSYTVSDDTKEKIKEEFKDQENKEKKKPGRPKAASKDDSTKETKVKVAKTKTATQPLFKTKRTAGDKVDLKQVEKSLGIQKSTKKVRATRKTENN
ncbi:hypothetical protein CYY_007946 [Polysphondylium violaceum]|uniref:BRCT domain-containing protein n=1 Tax=Polysphondylium violaceum TaxID=133409 RepID=A0A8J4PQ00_9MYCE|nr:hypothetical protein CYY_007946 [Polysphondylium violaceum]